MSRPAVADSQRPVWVYGTSDVDATYVATLDEFRATTAPRIAFYAENPRRVPEAVLRDPRLALIITSTPSPFSHDANLIRALVAELGIAGVCGLEPSRLGLATGAAFVLQPEQKRLTIDGDAVAISRGVAGSDEALGRTLAVDAVCYRPTYLYDDWLGRRIAGGLEAGIGALVMGGTARAAIDKLGRVWLIGGPTPAALADWIFSNAATHAQLLVDLMDALLALNRTEWVGTGMLSDPCFEKLFATNCLVAPFVGFPLFSLTARCASAGDGAMRELDERVTFLASMITAEERVAGRLGESTGEGVRRHLIALVSEGTTECDLVAATVAMSDVRRLVIDHLRRHYREFGDHARHRDLQ